MTNKNIQMKKREGNGWDNLFPLTLDENIYDKNGKSLESYKQEVENDIQELDEKDQFIMNDSNEKGFNIFQREDEVIDNDWAPVINEIIQEYDVIHIPKQIEIKTPIIMKRGLIINGGLNAVVKLTVDNQTAIRGNKFKVNYGDIDHAVINDVTFQGLGKGFNQIGMEARGYNTTLNNCDFRHFKIGLLQSGVIFHIERTLFTENKTGVVIEDLLATTGVGKFNTMISYHRTRFMYNDIGMENNLSGQQYPDNIVDFRFEDGSFEHNEQAFNLNVFTGALKNTWFEGQSIRPETKQNGWIFENLRYEGTNESIKFVDTNAEYSGTVEMDGRGGNLTAKRIKLQRFNSQGVEDSPNSLSVGRATNSRYYVQTSNENRGVLETARQMSGNSAEEIYNRLTNLIIKEDGTMRYNGADVNLDLTVSKLGTGHYKIKLSNGALRGVPQVMAVPPDATGDSSTNKGRYVSARIGNDISVGNFKQYLNYNVIYVKTFEEETHVLADSVLFISLYH